MDNVDGLCGFFFRWSTAHSVGHHLHTNRAHLHASKGPVKPSFDRERERERECKVDSNTKRNNDDDDDDDNKNRSRKRQLNAFLLRLSSVSLCSTFIGR